MHKTLTTCLSEKQNTDNCVELRLIHRKGLFAFRVLHNEVSRSRRQKRERGYLLEGFGFPMYGAESPYRKGKKGEG